MTAHVALALLSCALRAVRACVYKRLAKRWFCTSLFFVNSNSLFPLFHSFSAKWKFCLRFFSLRALQKGFSERRNSTKMETGSKRAILRDVFKRKSFFLIKIFWGKILEWINFFATGAQVVFLKESQIDSAQEWLTSSTSWTTLSIGNNALFMT